jgi:hypothetical protein
MLDSQLTISPEARIPTGKGIELMLPGREQNNNE